MENQQAIYSVIGLVFGALLGYELLGFAGFEEIGAVIGALTGSAFNYVKFADEN